MKTKEMQAEWKGMSERMMEGIAKWREEHPKASMREIEEEIDRQLSELRAKMISDTASQSRQADWKKGSRASVCPKCGEPLEKKGKKKRKLQTQGGREVELVREYGVCPKCGEEIFLLDEELGLLPGKLTPLGYERLVKLSGWLPFEKAVDVFGDFTGIEVSRIVSQRNTEAAGQAYVEMQNEEVEYLEKYAPKAEGGADKMQVSADGVMVPLLHGVWAEVRTLVVGEVQEQNGVIHTRNLSYFSRKVSAQEFQRLALVEMQRRGVENARAVAAIMDGADWEQGFTDYHCPQAVRILDFPHAAEHVNAIGESVYGQHTSESTSWLNERLHSLKHDGPDQVLAEIKKLERKRPDSQPIATHLNYLKKRRAQMQYPTFQTQG